jgi:hypothetical protein
VKCSVETVKSTIIRADPFDIIPGINSFLRDNAPLGEKYVYIGVSSADSLFQRISQQARNHKILSSRAIKEFDDRFRGFGAEGVGIAYVETIRHLVKGVMNKGEGWEPEALQGKGANVTVYMFCTDAPFEKKVQSRLISKGPLRNKAKPETRDPAKFWCVNCQMNLAPASVTSHMKIHARINYHCGLCDEIFTSEKKKDEHEEMHGIVLRCPNMNCRDVFSYAHLRRYHFKVSTSNRLRIIFIYSLLV